MITDKIKALICEDNLLEQLMSIPVTEILSFNKKADTVDCEEALRCLAEMYIDNCGISSGLRSFVDYCAVYWINELKLKEGDNYCTKYNDANNLPELLPFFSDEYTKEIDKYDIYFMEINDLRAILIDEINNASDDKTKIILCAGFCHCLSWLNSGFNWLDRYSPKAIEQGIINFQNKDLIHYRQRNDFQRFYRWNHRKSPSKPGHRHIVENWPDEFTEEEVAHFIVLNDRLVELQHEVMEQVKVITANLQEQIAKGFHQYDTFCIDGYIYIEPYEGNNENELLETLCQFAKYNVIGANEYLTPENFIFEIDDDKHWYANWSGTFHPLEKSHGMKLCRAFRYLFEENKIFTIADIIKIKPEMLLPHVEINI